MIDQLARNWWILFAHGLGGMIFGLLAFFWPGATLLGVMLLFGGFCLVDGVTAIGASLAIERSSIWWGMLLVGLVSVIAGVTTVLWPRLTGYALLMLIAVSAIVRGGLEIYAALSLRRVLRREGLFLLAGAASVLLGVFLLFRPGAGALAMIGVIGVVAFVRGGLLVVLALKLRAFRGGTPLT